LTLDRYTVKSRLAPGGAAQRERRRQRRAPSANHDVALHAIATIIGREYLVDGAAFMIDGRSECGWFTGLNTRGLLGLCIRDANREQQNRVILQIAIEDMFHGSIVVGGRA